VVEVEQVKQAPTDTPSADVASEPEADQSPENTEQSNAAADN